MPPAHLKHLEWTPERLINWGRKIGESCARAVQKIIESKPHPEQGYRACLGIMRLSRDYKPQRVEAACERALRFNACSYRSIKSILKTGLDKEPIPGPSEITPLPIREHKNVRGERYYAV